MNYKEKYKEIPKGYKNEVSDALNYSKNIISRWLANNVSPDTRCDIEEVVKEVWKSHNLVKSLTVTMGRKIMANHPLGVEFIDYDELLSFKIQTEQCIHDPTDVYKILENAKEAVETFKPYELKLLIAKKIIHDQRNNNNN